MRLLLAVHLYESAQSLVQEATLWAERLDATLDLVFVDEYVYDPILVEDATVRATLTEQWAKVREHQRQRLDALRRAIPEARRGEAWHLAGRGAPTIVEAGRDHDAILVGTHGRTGLTHLFLGSVAERVVRTSPVPVIVLRLATEGS